MYCIVETAQRQAAWFHVGTLERITNIHIPLDAAFGSLDRQTPTYHQGEREKDSPQNIKVLVCKMTETNIQFNSLRERERRKEREGKRKEREREKERAIGGKELEKLSLRTVLTSLCCQGTQRVWLLFHSWFRKQRRRYLLHLSELDSATLTV